MLGESTERSDTSFHRSRKDGAPVNSALVLKT
jgi:hypothetical protein